MGGDELIIMGGLMMGFKIKKQMGVIGKCVIKNGIQ